MEHWKSPISFGNGEMIAAKPIIDKGLQDWQFLLIPHDRGYGLNALLFEKDRSLGFMFEIAF